SLGWIGACGRANITEIAISTTQSVRCYTFKYALDLPDWIECIRAGPGWNAAGLTHSAFSIGDTDFRSAGNISVDVYSATESIVSQWHCLIVRVSRAEQSVLQLGPHVLRESSP